MSGCGHLDLGGEASSGGVRGEMGTYGILRVHCSRGGGSAWGRGVWHGGVIREDIGVLGCYGDGAACLCLRNAVLLRDVRVGVARVVVVRHVVLIRLLMRRGTAALNASRLIRTSPSSALTPTTGRTQAGKLGVPGVQGVVTSRLPPSCPSCPSPSCPSSPHTHTVSRHPLVGVVVIIRGVPRNIDGGREVSLRDGKRHISAHVVVVYGRAGRGRGVVLAVAMRERRHPVVAQRQRVSGLELDGADGGRGWVDHVMRGRVAAVVEAGGGCLVGTRRQGATPVHHLGGVGPVRELAVVGLAVRAELRGVGAIVAVSHPILVPLLPEDCQHIADNDHGHHHKDDRDDDHGDGNGEFHV